MDNIEYSSRGGTFGDEHTTNMQHPLAVNTPPPNRIQANIATTTCR